MNSFSALILKANQDKHEQAALLDQNAKRVSSWDVLRSRTFAVADYALAHDLHGIIPVYMDRSLEAVASILGLNLTGAGVAPISITTPKERCGQISGQTENALWTLDSFENAMEEAESNPHFDWNKIIDADEEEPENDSAYVVFTSGSTGVPKGVVLSNAAVISEIHRVQSPVFFNYTEKDTPLQSASFSFVVFIADMLAPLYAGCTVHVLPEEARGDAVLLSRYIREHGITTLFTSPQLYRNLECGSGLRCAAVGGDKIVNLAPKGHRLIGIYGMSETAGFAFGFDIAEAGDKPLLGRPAEDIQTYVLDENGIPAEEGELCISGAIASEYLDQPEKTASTFTPNPFCAVSGHEVLLHTGDLVRALKDGNYLFLSRKDDMLKINGQRVEPGEIESHICAFDGVSASVVKSFSDEENRSFLCAYYTAPAAVDEDDLIAFLENRLPHYMLPSCFVRLDSLPLNANGKIDRKSLKMPDFSAFQNEYAAPRNEIEAALCQAFETVLQLNKVGIHDDFFRMGGDSIRAMTLTKFCTGLSVTTRDILRGKTPAGIAALCENGRSIGLVSSRTVTDTAPLTDSQMGVYLECMLNPGSVKYNIPFHITLPRPALAENEIKERLDRVLALHPALYARIETRDEEVLMVREPFPGTGICSSVPGGQQELENLISDWVRPFRIESSPLCRVVFSLSEKSLHILADIHHLVADGSSVNILLREFCAAMEGQQLVSEQTDAFSLYGFEEASDSEEAIEQGREYFRTLLSSVEGDDSLPEDGNDAGSLFHPCKRLCIPVSGESFEEKLRKTDITASTLFMTAFAYSFAKSIGEEKCRFSVAESGRHSASFDSTVAMMVRTLPVVAEFDETLSGRKALAELQSQLFTSMEHDCVSFSELCREYGISNDVTFVYHSDTLSGFGDAGLELLETGEAIAKLSCSVLRTADGYRIVLDYRSDLYRADTIQRFANIMVSAVCRLLDDNPMSAIPLISDEERQILDSFNQTEPLSDEFDNYVDAFERSVTLRGDAPAVVFKDRVISYNELDGLSDRIAAYVHSLGIGTGQVVSVLVPRCEWIPIISLGVMKAGAVYEPLDPSYPPERLNYMVHDAECRLMIAERSLAPLVTEFSGPVFYLDDFPTLPPVPEKLADKPHKNDSFVILYTSGTTGNPKGCLLTHGNLLALVQADTRVMKITSASVHSFYASYGFDAHCDDLYPVLYAGGVLQVIPDEMRLDFPALKDYVETRGITHLTMTTQMARQFAVEYPFVRGLQAVSCGGEKLLPFPLPENYIFYNLYGPSECTVYVSGIGLEKEWENIPIGKVIPGERLYVVDSYDRRVPVGVPGELIICGPQVGKGYLHLPEKTASVFVPNVFENITEGDYSRCYRTGDIVRYLPDGNIEYIGRRDLQVKIRGFRIELSEVEKVIRSFPGILDATVIVVTETDGSKNIHAYVVSDEPVDISALHHYIRQVKPSYMVPAATMQIEKIPLTVNGKVDKRALPKIEKGVSAASEEHGRVFTELEEQLMQILKEIVGDGDFPVDMHFTDAGITSITSIKLASRIYKRFGISISTKDILEKGSVLRVENLIVNRLLSSEPVSAEQPRTGLEMYPLTQTQTGIYLDCLRAGMEAYTVPVLLELPEDIDTEMLKAAVETAVRAHPSLLCYVDTREDGEPALYPWPEMNITVEEETIDSFPPERTEFCFGQTALFRVRLIHYQGRRYLFLEAHHILADGESFKILLEDINRAYSENTVETENYTIFDLSLEEEKSRESSLMDDAHAYYDSVFRGLSADYLPAAESQNETRAASLRHRIKLSVKDVGAFCNAHGTTENDFFTSVFAITLAKYTAHDDALFTTIYNGRTDPRTERMTAMLVKTLPLYVSVDGESSVGDFLTYVSRHVKKVRQYDLFSFADSVQEYGLNADVMFIYQGQLLTSSVLDNRELRSIPVQNSRPKAELSAELYSDGNYYYVVIEYNAGHYSEKWVSSFADAYATCAANLITAEKLSEVEILSKGGYLKFKQFNNSRVPVSYRPVYRLLEEQAALHPDRAAVVAHSDREKPDIPLIETLSYRQLDRLANALAWQLLKKDLPRESVVGILCGRSKEVHISEFGILKAGCAFLYLSPAYPDDRISYIADESEIKVIVTTRRYAEEKKDLFTKLGISLIYADELNCDDGLVSPSLEIDGDALAYLTYTSGSTGKPKGVMLTQAGLLNLCDINRKNVVLEAILSPVAGAVTAFTFDASLNDTILSTAVGMTVCVATEDEIHNPEKFRLMCLRNHVTSLTATPSFLMSLLDYPDFSEVIMQLDAVQCGGESFPRALYEKLRTLNPGLRIINCYGPSETTIGCAAKLLDSADNITIGKPLNNYTLFTIDKYNHILPMGALGELIIMGVGVGRGYMKREDLTSKVFITIDKTRAYRSGDLALITHSGEVEFHGRIDNQVKLRGLRIELGEVENAINSYGGVKNSIVLLMGPETNRFLAAYYTAEKEIAPEEISAHISKTLAAYMVPTALMQLPSMPLTANGKIDKKALPDILSSRKTQTRREPKNELEKLLCELYAEVLGLQEVTPGDNFFEIGGNSLLASKAVMQLKSRDIKLEYQDIFDHQSPEELSIYLKLRDEGQAAGEVSILDEDPTPPELRAVLSQNNLENASKVERKPLGDVLLTGVTGFLGIHILRELLEKEEGKIVCLMRKSSFSSLRERLNILTEYYFSQVFTELYPDRLTLVDGDITSDSLIGLLQPYAFNTIINCAASVKHYASDNSIERTNVKGLENLIPVAQEHNAALIQISTTSVSGAHTPATLRIGLKLRENQCFSIDDLGNQYAISKLRAEQKLLTAVSEGRIRGKVIRVGNLMGRYSDGDFQMNMHTNAFLNGLRGFVTIGKAPISHCTDPMEYSPVDKTAEAIVLLAGTNDCFTLFHANERFGLDEMQVLSTCTQCGLPVEFVPDEEYYAEYTRLLGDESVNSRLSGLVTNDRPDLKIVDSDNTFTANILYRLGFSWPYMDQAYLIRIINALKTIGFFM